MSSYIFQNKLFLMVNYIDKLNKEKVPFDTQMILIKSYASDLKLNLTKDMILQMLSYKHINYPIYKFH